MEVTTVNTTPTAAQRFFNVFNQAASFISLFAMIVIAVCGYIVFYRDANIENTRAIQQLQQQNANRDKQLETLDNKIDSIRGEMLNKEVFDMFLKNQNEYNQRFDTKLDNILLKDK